MDRHKKQKNMLNYVCFRRKRKLYPPVKVVSRGENMKKKTMFMNRFEGQTKPRNQNIKLLKGGFVRIGNNGITFLINDVEKVSNIDLQEAQQTLETIKAKLR